MLFGTISFLFQTDRSKKQVSGVSKKKMGSSAERVSEKWEGVCFFWTPLLRQWSEILVCNVVTLYGKALCCFRPRMCSHEGMRSVY